MNEYIEPTKFTLRNKFLGVLAFRGEQNVHAKSANAYFEQ